MKSNGRKKGRLHSVLRWCCLGVALCVLLICTRSTLAQSNDREGLSESYSGFHELADEIKEGFDYLIKAVGYGNLLAPNINFPVSSISSAAVELRPDFSLNFRRLRLVAKPRAAGTWEKWYGNFEIEDEPVLEDDQVFEDEWFVNEWLARLGLTNDLYVSYGRENLQWGPSVLFSPSNPFYKDNGRTNPLGELPGMDFARLVWIVNPVWAVSLIANLDEGRRDFLFGFEPTYALKLDFTGDRKYFSLIPSKREGDKGQLGAYAGWNVTDAVMLHGEMSLFYGVNLDYQLYQLERLGIVDLPDVSANQDVDKYRDTDIESLLLVGGSYTFEAGGTLSLEYVYNSAGFTDEQADQFNEGVLQVLEVPPSILRSFVDLSPEFLGEGIIPELTLFRRNYIMLQYQHTRITNSLSILLRFAYNLDDDSSRFTPIIAYDIDDHTQLYFVGRKNFGPVFSEYQFFYDSSFTIGLEYTF